MQEAIAAGHRITVEVGKEILRDGGNAFDAAIAAYAAMFVTEPCMASAGAGGLAMCFTPSAGPRLLDFFAQTPNSKHELNPRDYEAVEVDFGSTTEVFYTGLASVAVPGAIAGLFELHQRFGTIPISRLFEPAAELARRGVEVNGFQAEDFKLLEPILAKDGALRTAFFTGEGLIRKGQILRLPLIADFLEFLAEEGRAGFYQGEPGALVARAAEERGGYLQRSDFERYSVRWEKPMHISVYDQQLYLPNGPSLGGALMALLFDSVRKLDGNWARAVVDVRRKYNSANNIRDGMHKNLKGLQFHLGSGSGMTRGTSHFNICDRFGNAISLSTTIGEGAGYCIPGTQMQLNNMLGELYLLPNGAHSWIPNTRLHSMMTPVLALDHSKQVSFAGGSGGAGRIPFMLSQVLDHLFGQDLPLAEAISTGRIHFHEGVLQIEQGAPERDYGGDFPVNRWTYQSLFFGGVHAICRRKGYTEACGDRRREGYGEVW